MHRRAVSGNVGVLLDGGSITSAGILNGAAGVFGNLYGVDGAPAVALTAGATASKFANSGKINRERGHGDWIGANSRVCVDLLDTSKSATDQGQGI